MVGKLREKREQRYENLFQGLKFFAFIVTTQIS